MTTVLPRHQPVNQTPPYDSESAMVSRTASGLLLTRLSTCRQPPRGRPAGTRCTSNGAVQLSCVTLNCASQAYDQPVTMGWPATVEKTSDSNRVQGWSQRRRAARHWCPPQRRVVHRPTDSGRPAPASPEHRGRRLPVRHTDCPTGVDAPVADSHTLRTARAQRLWQRPASRKARDAAHRSARTPRLETARVFVMDP